MHLFDQWNSFSSYFSAESTQIFLQKCYRKKQVINAEQKGYENCYSFIYYLEHGQLYYQQAHNAPLAIKPILLFYGLVHLIKASILTIDPNYPETTSVLAHGVSTRKRKKQQYSFFEDEVKFQKSGLFPFMSEKMFHMKQLEGEKIAMGDLFKCIPEMNSLYTRIEGYSTFIPVKLVDNMIIIPTKILDAYHMTEDRFIDYFISKLNSQAWYSHKDGEQIIINLNEKTSEKSDLYPLKYNIFEKNFSLPLCKKNLLLYPELLVHYLLLYNLSMIARYEVEWWNELIKMMPNKDYPFINTFLHTTLYKGPYLIYKFLNSN